MIAPSSVCKPTATHYKASGMPKIEANSGCFYAAGESPCSVGGRWPVRVWPVDKGEGESKVDQKNLSLLLYTSAITLARVLLGLPIFFSCHVYKYMVCTSISLSTSFFG